jgi:acetyl esterase/lipase
LGIKFWGLTLVAMIATAAQGAAADSGGDRVELARAFGARPFVEDVSLSPDGKHIVYITPGAGAMTVAMVEDLATGDSRAVTFADGKPLRLTGCNWSANDRLVCRLYGVTLLAGHANGWSRLVAVNLDGTKPLEIGNSKGSPYMHYSDGQVLDWLSSESGKVLLARQQGYDIVIEKVDTRTGQHVPVSGLPDAGMFFADGQGTIRAAGFWVNNGAGDLLRTNYQYRLAGAQTWQTFSNVTKTTGLRPVYVDGANNNAYAVQKIDGREALYRVALDGTLKTDLIYADPEVDVDEVATIGRTRRAIGYQYVTDRRHVVYFDPAYKMLALSLTKALPSFPIIAFANASEDERKILLFAGSDSDPGHHFLFDRDTHKLTEVLQERPALQQIPLAEVKSITFPASDGTQIPAYLMLPKGSNGRGLPALVMPHGGPSARDVWGFDWVAQYFVARGFAVIKPQYRGSSGYGEKYQEGNAVKSWRAAISDVVDSGRWLVKQGIADPAKLAIFGWSYGGYAALQSNYLAPDLFHAVVAVAPVTDFASIRDERELYTISTALNDFAGTRANAVEGSPIRHVAIFKAPVLMFHGDHDVNVDIAQSRTMDTALRAAGKSSRLVVYPDLDHQLVDAAARADMLEKADAFLTVSLGLPDTR